MDSTPSPGFRAGMVVLVGRTNVGKSTLLNALVRTRLSIVTPKPQTTRHPIQGVVHRPEGQIVFVDTPGFFRTHRSALVERLHARARAALAGIDLVVHVVDPSRPPGPEEEMVRRALEGVPQPRLLCLNKADLQRRPHREAYLSLAEGYAATVEVSALAGQHVDDLVSAVLARLPVAPPLYPPDEITNAHRDFRITEIVREAVYLQTEEEVPYRTAVRLDDCRVADDPASVEHRTPALVRATILVGEERYKGMLIGAGGRRVRSLRRHARAGLEKLLNRPVSLELAVKVSKHLPE